MALLNRKAEVDAAVQLAVETLALRDYVGRSHALGVMAIAEILAKEMGFDGEELERVRVGSVLHDLGKLGVPDAILRKRGRLTREEYRQVQEHPKTTADILRQTDIFRELADVVLLHHEHWNGGGYPGGPQRRGYPARSADHQRGRRHRGDDPRSPLSSQARPRRRSRRDQPAYGAPVLSRCGRHLSRRCEMRSRHCCSEMATRSTPCQSRPGLDKSRPGSSHTITSTTSKPGEKAMVAHIGGSGELRRRLLELGVVPGVQVEVVRVAPMGDPMEVSVRRASFFLPKEEAARIGVHPGDDEPGRASSVARPPGIAPLSRRYHMAVAGNPNTGKTSLFNALTGDRAGSATTRGSRWIDYGELELESGLRRRPRRRARYLQLERPLQRGAGGHRRGPRPHRIRPSRTWSSSC